MNDSYPVDAGEVKPAHARPVKMQLILGTVPTAYIPVEHVVQVLGVSVDQAETWCKTGVMPALQIGGLWWITAADLHSFVARSRWRLVSVPGSSDLVG
jgi:hypothetical protein